MNALNRTIDINILPINVDALVYDEDSSSRELLFVIGRYIDTGGGTTKYSELIDKPKINNIELVGNKTAAQLGLQTELTIDATPTEGSTNPVQSGGVFTALENLIAEDSLFGGFVGPDTQPWHGNDHRYFYIAFNPGTYVNFNNWEISEPSMFFWNQDFWGYTQLWLSEQTINDMAALKANIVNGATAGNFAGLDADGNLTDSGIAASDVATTSDLADKLDAPSTAGTSGQVLTSDGQGGQSWQTPSGGGGTATDVQVNGTSITSNNVANIVTNTAYNASSNKIATMSDLPSVPVTDVTVGGTSVVSGGVAVVPAIPTVPTISTDVASDATSDTKTTSPKAVKTFVENKGYGTYSKPSGGIPASDLASGVIPNSVVNATSQQDGTVVLTMVNGDIITIDLNHTHPNYYKKVVETTQPSGGMLPDVVYELGTLTGATTFTFAAAVSGNVNHYYFTFTSGSTAVVPTWPAAITSWDGNCVDSNTGLPIIAASKTYEVSVLDGNAIIKEW